MSPRETMSPREKTTWIWRARLMHGVGQKDLAAAAGVSTGSIYRWERGMYQPTPEQLEAIEPLIGREDDPELAKWAPPEPPPESQLRRRRRVRARTIAAKRLTKENLRIGRLLYPETDYWKPATREHCSKIERPCPFVSCKHHLYLDVNPATGSIKLNFPDIEVWEMDETCALDVADRGGITLEDLGELMNLTRERVRQVELRGLENLRDARALRGHL